MLVLLPPSEGKASASRGRTLDLCGLSFPELTATRHAVLDSLVHVCRSQPADAVRRLGLSPGLVGEVARNADLETAATLPVARLYTGVLYDALDLASLDAPARRRATRNLVVVSALFGALRLGDRVPRYRLAMNADLPGIGPLAAAWREPLSRVLPAGIGRGLLVDLRSSTYAAAWVPPPALAERTVAVRVLREHAGRRTVVSHMAKHTRGELARELVQAPTAPRTPAELAELAGARWTAELTAPARAGRVWALDLVINEG
ncbi:MAG TPA: peroxide stress protein YaaA [Actinomycetes bacterium]|nr:peroxide stress protein YaaA [Actinomycetes bacterium]